jgi:hypothetical protein
VVLIPNKKRLKTETRKRAQARRKNDERTAPPAIAGGAALSGKTSALSLHGRNDEAIRLSLRGAQRRSNPLIF